jgi:hypothetical protein
MTNGGRPRRAVSAHRKKDGGRDGRNQDGQEVWPLASSGSGWHRLDRLPRKKQPGTQLDQAALSVLTRRALSSWVAVPAAERSCGQPLRPCRCPSVSPPASAGLVLRATVRERRSAG